MKYRFVWPALLLAALLLLVLVIFGPFLVPIPPLPVRSALKALAGPNSRFVDVPFAGHTLTVHYEEAGEKKPGQGRPAIVLLHGFASSTFSWREVLPKLGERGRTVAFDRPAFGLTERPLPESWQGDWKTQNPYALDAQVELTTGLMDQLGIDEAVLVGNSAGGAVAMLTALEISRASQGARLDRSGGLQWRQPITDRALAGQHAADAAPGAARRTPDSTLGAGFARSAWHDPAQMTDDIWEGYQKPLQAADWDRALWEMTAANAPSGLPARLAELTLPVLVITGDDDRIVPTEQSVKLANELPNAELVVVPACGHVPQEECPQVVLDAIQTFLAGLEG